MARNPTIAYVFLRNAHFGPRLASSVELCVRDLIGHSRYASSTMVACPRVDESFEGIRTEPIPDVGIGGNLGKALAIGRLMRRRNVAVALVENHLPAAAFIAATSGLPVILHSHAYEKAPSGALKRKIRNAELRAIAGLAFVSEDCANRFRANFPAVLAPMCAVPNGLDMTDWSDASAKEKTILCVGRALDDKGHLEAMSAIARALESRPDWSARMILSATDREPETMEALREAAKPFGGRVRIEANRPYAEVKIAWQKASVGLVLTKTPEPFGRTALEALASGTALITSGLGGLAEVCGPDALTVDPRNADEVAAALASLLDSPERRSALARAGRARAAALFDIRIVANRMDNFIDEVIAQKRR